MPTYDYVCKTCGQNFELRQKMTDDPIKECPKIECTGEVKRLISGPSSFVLLGGGWFKDGY